MNRFRADLHIHSLLSPCGSLEMSPAGIVEGAIAAQLDMIAVTDHNHTGHCRLVRKLAEKTELYVFFGAEVTTREEVHCLALFEEDEQIENFQEYLDLHLPPIPNHPDYFGDQVIVGEQEEILRELPYLLTNGIGQSISEVEREVHKLGGLFIPAHVDRFTNGIYQQLGLLPSDMQADGIEISRFTTATQMLELHPELKDYTLIQDSDAHFPTDIGRAYTIFEMKKPCLEELAKALRGEKGRRVRLL